MTGRHRRFEVAVTGLGLVTPAGIGVEANWETICAGESVARIDESLAGNPVDFVCRVPDFDAAALLGGRKAARLDRVNQLALVAARQALVDAGFDPTDWDGTRVGVVIGNSFGGCATYEKEHAAFLEQGPQIVSPTLMVTAPVNMSAGYIAIECQATGPNFVVSTACASGATAIGLARQLLESRMCDIVIAGGTESFLTRTTLASLTNMGAMSRRRDDPAAASRPFDVDRDGFVAGEGAAILVLERAADARARGARIRANISGYGSSADGFHASRPDPQGGGAERALRAALADALVEPEEVAHVNAHGTSTPLNDVTESRLIRRVLGDRPAVTSTKGVIGHLIGAAGAAEAAYAVLAVQHGLVPPTANLTSQDPQIEVDVVAKAPRGLAVDVAVSNSFGFGGQNAVLVVTAP
ncbi:beta-ketoacyl-[acyl-carrier-protein] synthase family protein [Micromonospora sp. NPDC047557]|uniref:beta-ketoacyl-[acyl-carrier-protein] synthase family protein n=1 Tax=Micromonospora sp. NPDC047557 TaxID=3364250 RepID=UPI00371842A3